jgi:natural resistance-associated macrophage protein
MSIAYLDPGNSKKSMFSSHLQLVAGDLDAGKTGGYRLLWTLLWATALGWFFQVLSARLGVVTQRNLAKICREQFPKRERVVLWLMTEIAIIGSDIQVIF